MAVFSHTSFDHHAEVAFWEDSSAGLRAIAAIHRLGLRHALGCTRLVAYDNDEAALADVLRLSRAMSYKSAISGLPWGGGKCVVAGPFR